MTVRIARVIGTVTLNRRLPDLPAARYLVVQPCGRGDLSALAAASGAGETPASRMAPAGGETLTMYDDLGARPGDLVGLVEGREAAVPFGPARVPYDCYNACILEAVNFEPVLEERQPATGNRQPGVPRPSQDREVARSVLVAQPTKEKPRP
jgi:hypothetical protein